MAAGESERTHFHAFGAAAADYEARWTRNGKCCRAGDPNPGGASGRVSGSIRAALQRFGRADYGKTGKPLTGSAVDARPGNRRRRGGNAIYFRGAGVLAQRLRMDGAFGLAVTAIKARPDRVAIRKQRGV